MAQNPRPSVGQNQIPDRHSAAPVRTTLHLPAHDKPASSPVGTANGDLLDLTSSNPLIEAVLGPNKDGRVRNPVPSKLKGKTDDRQGNFGVMHMGMGVGGKKNETQGKDAAAERDAAARRTSENTANRAKAAQQDKYVAPKKRGVVEATMNEAARVASRGSPFPRDDKRQSRPLAPDETKFEQARLLTLLRSINPITVIDQICKAVAYFGGIPGAPPPEDGIFPESANTRETGALFIGWLAEIFPDVSTRGPEPPVPPGVSGALEGGVKVRPSKYQVALSGAGPPNSSNGYGYGPAVSAPAWGLPNNLAEVNPQAPNVPEAGLQRDAGVEQRKQPEHQPQQPQKPEQQPQQQPPPPPQPPQQQQQLPQPPPSTPAKPPQDPSTATSSTNTSKRGRGRPKGSTNKKSKADIQQVVDNTASSNYVGSQGQNQTTAVQPTQQPNEGARATDNTLRQDQNQSNAQPALNNKPPAPQQVQQPLYAGQTLQNSSQTNLPKQTPVIIADELSPEERAVLEAFRNHGAEGLSALPSPVVSAIKGTKSLSEAGQKRKRAPPKPKPNQSVPVNPSINNFQVETPQSVQNRQQVQPHQQLQTHQHVQTHQQAQPPKQVQNHQQAPSPKQGQIHQQVPPVAQKSTPLSAVDNDIVMSIAKEAIQWAPADASTPTGPPSKRARQRKPKVLNANASDPSSRNRTASVMSSATPPTQASTIPDSTAASSQQSIPVTRPPAEGLEAHYERFASFSQQQNLSQQQNGRSNTPAVAPQHVRQQSKPSSASQQAAPKIPQQMQHQKSQQASQKNIQREDQNVIQGTEARPQSNFYNQRSQSTSAYNQQYPSHQPSQLYGSHSASPQMNNTYRASAAHSMAQNTLAQNTMAQSSPQFSQVENSYRTASPHAMSQTSPSLSQADTAFRSNSAHTIAQPSPSFSQAESTYRTPSTHSMTQPTQSYSTARSHAQQRQTPSTHQNQYSQFSESSFLDLPTLESLGHSGSGGNSSLGGFGQGMSVGLGGTSNSSTSHRASGSNTNLYGGVATSSALSNAFDATVASDLLRVSRGSGGSPAHTHPHTHATYAGGASFDTSEQEMRERLLRGLGR
ncbi:uncharacterized protein BP5553_02101 [Venustampulla echinocandica]|uniref:Uncharacterized protein n=1 Tax=Venustampulla echinocandica TaxID=2656787 RepID=A0A370U2W6_9HELO|nr:uncharacterized protein BP5553_02101 [Venustampulla echinocandica]RDL42122.1 hypothetical protein BP5553_02101 [Venustampulla echinocandica]